MNEDRFIIGIGQGDHEYTVNGVKYIVNPVFRPFDFIISGISFIIISGISLHFLQDK